MKNHHVLTPADVIMLANMQGKADESTDDANDYELTRLFRQSLAELAQGIDEEHAVFGVEIDRSTSEESTLDLADPAIQALAAEYVADSHRRGFGSRLFAEAALDDESRQRLSEVRAERARLWKEHSSRWPGETPSFEETQRAVDEVLARTATDPILDAVESLRQRLVAAMTAYIDEVRAGGCPLVTLAAHLRSIGEHGEALATSLEANEKAQNNPFIVWLNPNRPGLASYPSMLAEVLWVDVVRPQMEAHERARKNTGALALYVWPTFAGYALGKGREFKEDNGQLQLLNADGKPIATAHVPGESVERIIQSGPDFFANYPAMMLIDYLVKQCAYRHFVGDQNPTIFQFDGGVEELADTIGITSKRQRTQLRDVLIAGDMFRTDWPGNVHRTGLWQYDETRKGKGSKRAHIDIRLSAHLAPMYVHKLPEDNRILVPRVDIDDVAGIAGTQNHGTIAAAKWGITMMLIESKARRVELATFGGVGLVQRDWQRLAKMVGVTLPTIMKAHDAWLIDRDEGPAFLEFSQGRYHLANNDKYHAARDFLTRTANKTKGAVKGAKNSHKPTSKRRK